MTLFGCDHHIIVWRAVPPQPSIFSSRSSSSALSLSLCGPTAVVAACAHTKTISSSSAHKRSARQRSGLTGKGDGKKYPEGRHKHRQTVAKHAALTKLYPPCSVKWFSIRNTRDAAKRSQSNNNLIRKTHQQ